MIIDSHAHFEPRMLGLEDAIAKMDAAGVDKVALIPAMNDTLPHTPEVLLTVVRKLMRSPITRPLAEAIHRQTMTADGNLRLKGKTIRIYPQPDNASVAEVLRAQPDRFVGWIFLNPKVDPDPVESLHRWLDVDGFIGVKLHPHWHDYETELLDPILARCEDLALPVLVHLGFGKRGDFRTMAARHPGLTIIAAHAGIPFYDDLWRYRNAYRNLYVDLSSPYLDEALVRDTVASMGPERCLYGTDAPYGFSDEAGYDYGEIKRWIERLPVPAKKKDGIFGNTFRAMIET